MEPDKNAFETSHTLPPLWILFFLFGFCETSKRYHIRYDTKRKTKKQKILSEVAKLVLGERNVVILIKDIRLMSR